MTLQRRNCRHFYWTRPEFDHYCLPLKVTILTQPLLLLKLNRYDFVAFEDAKSKLFDAVSVADGGEEECVDNNLVEILKLKFRRDSKSEFWPKYRRF